MENGVDKEVVNSDSIQELSARSKVLVLYTGGTMGMKPGTSGALTCAPGYLTERIEKEILTQDNMPECDIIEYDELVDSSLITPSRWIEFAKDIEKHYANYDGTHSTSLLLLLTFLLSFTHLLTLEFVVIHSF